MAPDTSSSTRRWRGVLYGCVGSIVASLTLLVLVLGILAFWLFGSLQQALNWVEEWPDRLFSQSLKTTFQQSVLRATSNKGDILEVGTLETDETVTRFDMKTAFNEAVYLGTTVSEIRVPVVYRYHIKISETWDLQVRDGRCTVRAPVLRSSPPPAIRTEGMVKKSEAGWLRFNAAENLALLEKELTTTLENRALNDVHVKSVREAARRSVAEFVKTWLLEQKADGRVQEILVTFQDEPSPQQNKDTPPLPATLTLP